MTDIVEALDKYIKNANKQSPFGISLMRQSKAEIELLRAGYQEISETEGLCVKPWTSVRCEGCECGDKNYE